MSDTQSNFVYNYENAARTAAKLAGVTDPAQVDAAAQAILAQWAQETGWGSSNLAKDANNLAGIKCHTGCTCRGEYCTYSSTAEFVKDYTNVLQNGLYGNVLSALRTADPGTILKEFSKSPWDQGGYSSANFSSILQSIKRYFDPNSPVMSPTEAAAPSTLGPYGDIWRECGGLVQGPLDVVGYLNYFFCVLKIELKYIAVNLFVFVIIALLIYLLFSKLEQEPGAVGEVIRGTKKAGKAVAETAAHVAAAAAA
ncbi:MAG: glucosaminidase domain-containing protein [Thermoproteota archaeon]